MHIMVVGAGGREHAMCRALANSPQRPQITIAPGNPGTAQLGQNRPVTLSDQGRLVQLAREEAVDLVLVGPEAPLVAGLADALAAAGIACVGAARDAARLEGSKALTRQLCAETGVPAPRFRIVSDPEALAPALADWSDVPVVKADGLASGKGVFLPQSLHEAHDTATRLLAGALGDAGRRVVLEEPLRGTEASLFFACAGRSAQLLPHAQDYKRRDDGDRGPNTGGMGAVSPNPQLGDDVVDDVRQRIVQPVLDALAGRGMPFRGFLYAGVMLTDTGPKLLEFNVRLGDPETQAVLPRLAPGAFLELCREIAADTVSDSTPLAVRTEPTCAVVLAAAGYPDTPRQGDSIHLDPALETDERWVVHAGTQRHGDALTTAGGRVAAIVARGSNAHRARERAYEGIAHIHFTGMHYRTDIGC